MYQNGGGTKIIDKISIIQLKLSKKIHRHPEDING